jgi:hypothetical protein
MGGTRRMHGKDEKCLHFGMKTWKEEPLGRPKRRWDNIKWILKKWSTRMWTGFNWLWIGSNGGLFWTRFLSFKFHKSQNPKVQHRWYQSPPMNTILSQFHPMLITYIPKIRLPSQRFPKGFPIKLRSTPFVFFILVTCTAHCILLNTVEVNEVHYIKASGRLPVARLSYWILLKSVTWFKT